MMGVPILLLVLPGTHALFSPSMLAPHAFLPKPMADSVFRLWKPRVQSNRVLLLDISAFSHAKQCYDEASSSGVLLQGSAAWTAGLDDDLQNLFVVEEGSDLVLRVKACIWHPKACRTRTLRTT